jgi:hypothetical protein
MEFQELLKKTDAKGRSPSSEERGGGVPINPTGSRVVHMFPTFLEPTL